ncbi:hypothetical protein HPB47_000219, partial [Ixodes persulcatus]
MCKILKSEYWRQVRLYLDWLRVVVQEGKEHQDNLRFAEYKKLASQTTEFLWQRARLNLPPKRKFAARATDNVTLLGDATIPADVKDILEKGPKHSFEPSSTRHELLAMVHKVADRVNEQDRERAIGDGVDCLRGTTSHMSKAKPPFGKI